MAEAPLKIETGFMGQSSPRASNGVPERRAVGGPRASDRRWKDHPVRTEDRLDTRGRALRNVLPADDKCVAIADPITRVLDRIQAGDTNSLDVRYFVSRIQAAEDPDLAAANAYSARHGQK